MDIKEEEIERYLSSQYPKEAILKDGSGVTIRPALDNDKNAIKRLYERLSQAERWFIEMNQPFSFNDDILREKDGFSLVAVLEKQIVAHGVLYRLKPKCLRHVGLVNITVHPNCRGKNLATWLLLDITNFAMELKLELLTMNLAMVTKIAITRGIEKLGFKELAILKDYLRDMEGKPHDLAIMMKRINVNHTE